MPRGREKPSPPPRPPRPVRPARPAPAGSATAGSALRQLFAEGFKLGWAALLEIVLLGMIWTLIMLAAWGALLTSLLHSGRLVITYLLPPLPLAGPASVALYAAVDAIWSGEAVGPFDGLRNFGRGFVHRYLRSVGLGALWVLIVVGAFANLLVGGKVLPGFLIGGTRIVLGYLLLFFAMASAYAVPILATTEENLTEVVRLAAWQAVANPLFTLGALVPAAVVAGLGMLMTPVLPALLLGGTLALFSTGALRYAPLRHPDLPPPYWENAPMEDGGDEAPPADDADQ